jgi:hypothetical protein
MQCTPRSIPARLILALAAGLAAWGESAAGEPPKAAGASAAAVPCPAPTDIETAIGFPVTPVSVPIDGCVYELTGRYRGAMITLMYQPATRADDVYGEMRKAVKIRKGQKAEPDRLTLGEGGWGYGSSGSREAAVVSQGYLYHVEMNFEFLSSMNLREDAAIRVIELAMRAAPAAKLAGSSSAARGGAPFDACALATNAEVSEIAEEKPEIAKFWSAPTASLGGSHCDYDGGSIRVYQGKAPAADFDATLKTFKADKEPRVPVGGIGDKAFFMIPMPYDKYNRLGLLAVYAGSRVVQLTLDANGNERIAATQPRLERLAKLVLPRLR